MKNDMYMWEMVCEVLKDSSDECKEYVYNKFEGKFWSIEKLERAAIEYNEKGSKGM